MFPLGFLKQFARFNIGSIIKTQIYTKNISTTAAVQIKITDQLWAEPMKKKKKMDPAIVKAREERRRKKLEKQIRRLQKNARQLKPIAEIEPPLHLLDEQHGKCKRSTVVLTTEEIEARALLNKDWCRHKRQEYMKNIAQIDRIMAAQKRALEMLYEESEDLYNEALLPDLSLIPYSVEGTYATPPIKNYESPDGECLDVSKKWGQ